jgi:hypothetical protein
MGLKFNPLTSTFDLVGSGGGSAFFAGEVATYADLPLDGTAALNSRWLVRSSSGTWPFPNYRQGGIYIRTSIVGSSRDNDYTLADTKLPDVFADSAFLLYDNSDSTRNLQFDLGGISTGQTRTLTAPNASGTIALTSGTTFTTLTANNGTLTASAPVLDLAQTWNNAAVTFTGLRFNVTNTASDSNSHFAEFQTGGVTQFAIRNTGEIRVRSSPRISSLVGATWATWITGSYNNLLEVHAPQLRLGADGSGSTRLFVDGANIFAQRDGTAAQTFNIYNTYSSSTNHERGFLKWSSNVFQIGTEKGSGGGTARALEFQTDGATRMHLSTGGAVGFGGPTGQSTTLVGWAGNCFMRPINASAGVLTLLNAALDGFNRLQFGGTTSSFPALKRDSTAIHIRLADDSAFAPLSCAALTLNGNLDASTRDIVTDTTTGTKIGTVASQKIGFFGATPVDRPATVSKPDPFQESGTVDADARTAVNAVIDRLQELGLIAT